MSSTAFVGPEARASFSTEIFSELHRVLDRAHLRMLEQRKAEGKVSPVVQTCADSVFVSKLPATSTESDVKTSSDTSVAIKSSTPIGRIPIANSSATVGSSPSGSSLLSSSVSVATGLSSSFASSASTVASSSTSASSLTSSVSSSPGLSSFVASGAASANSTARSFPIASSQAVASVPISGPSVVKTAPVAVSSLSRSVARSSELGPQSATQMSEAVQLKTLSNSDLLSAPRRSRLTYTERLLYQRLQDNEAEFKRFNEVHRQLAEMQRGNIALALVLDRFRVAHKEAVQSRDAAELISAQLRSELAKSKGDLADAQAQVKKLDAQLVSISQQQPTQKCSRNSKRSDSDLVGRQVRALVKQVAALDIKVNGCVQALHRVSAESREVSAHAPSDFASDVHHRSSTSAVETSRLAHSAVLDSSQSTAVGSSQQLSNSEPVLSTSTVSPTVLQDVPAVASSTLSSVVGLYSTSSSRLSVSYPSPGSKAVDDCCSISIPSNLSVPAIQSPSRSISSSAGMLTNTVAPDVNLNSTQSDSQPCSLCHLATNSTESHFNGKHSSNDQSSSAVPVTESDVRNMHYVSRRSSSSIKVGANRSSLASSKTISQIVSHSSLPVDAASSTVISSSVIGSRDLPRRARRSRRRVLPVGYRVPRKSVDKAAVALAAAKISSALAWLQRQRVKAEQRLTALMLSPGLTVYLPCGVRISSHPRSSATT